MGVYKSIRVTLPVFQALFRLKARLEAERGRSITWDEFFREVIPELKRKGVVAR